MSENFDAYATCYDAFNRNKDYAAESEYLDALIRHYRPGSQTLLELGCGTGGHAIHFAQAGYRVTGIDRSEAMIARARKRASESPTEQEYPKFHAADLRSLRLGKEFDVVVLLFHVMSYQVTDDDLRSTMATVSEHLKKDGLLIFDCWYGPGVLSDPPTTRIRRADDGDTSYTRIAEPQHFPEMNRVDVHYEILIEHNDSGRVDRIRETHPMRYLFTPEVDLLLATAGLSRVVCHEWMTSNPPKLDTWNVCYVASAG